MKKKEDYIKRFIFQLRILDFNNYDDFLSNFDYEEFLSDLEMNPYRQIENNDIIRLNNLLKSFNILPIICNIPYEIITVNLHTLIKEMLNEYTVIELCLDILNQYNYNEHIIYVYDDDTKSFRILGEKPTDDLQNNYKNFIFDFEKEKFLQSMSILGYDELIELDSVIQSITINLYRFVQDYIVLKKSNILDNIGYKR